MAFRLLTVGVAAVLAGSCGPSSHISLGSPTTTAPPTTISTTADGGQEPAILAAYRGSLADFNRVSTTVPLQPDDPQLGDHMAGKELMDVVDSLSKLSAAGQIDVGTLTSLRASVTQYNGTQAVVASCQFDTGAIVDVATKAVVSKASNSTEFVNDLMALQSGKWVVIEGSQVSPGCH